MDKKIFADIQQKITRYVNEHRLRDAFSLCRTLVEGVGARDMAGDIAMVEEGYRYMLEYAARGAEDPGRSDMAQQIGEQILTFADRLHRANNKKDAPTYYFNILRYEELQQHTLPNLINDYRKGTEESSLFNLVVSGAHSTKVRDRLAQNEALERRIFNRLWVTFPLSRADVEAVNSCLTSADMPAYFRELLVSALLIGGLEYYDEKRLDLLLNAYTSSETRVSTAAFIALSLLLYKGRNRKLSSSLRAKLDTARELHEWHNDLRTAYMELAKTIDTDRISRKINEEVVPEMMKLRPEIDKKLNINIERIDAAELEENPEWQDMLDKSGIADKLKEMSEIQEEGGDVMMGTFAHLKSFPFFNETVNWFLPFHTDYSEFTGDDAAVMQPVADLMMAAPFLCDSDKYSFMFSLRMVPASQREMMLSQLKAHGNQMAELRAASLNVGNVSRKNIINKQVQNLYRFFNLFRRKGEFANPFAEGVNLVEVNYLQDDLQQLGILPIVGEYYFSHKYYEQAIQIFEAMAQEETPDVQLYQKMGYALQKTAQTERAVEFYLKAEMLDSRSDWTLRRLARCFMTLRQPKEALTRLKALAERHPNNVAIVLNMARCLVETEQYEDAVKAYYKAEYLDEKSGKALRPLAWCLMLIGEFDRSAKYFEKLAASTDLTPTDYLNMGHLALAHKNFSEALNLYSIHLTARGGNATGEERRKAIDDFIADMRNDAPYLKRMGVDEELLPLLIDSLLYTI